MKRYTIKSVSDEGEWYLVNHWNTYKAFWQKQNKCTPNNTFKTVGQARASLTKLLKVMPEYSTDTFEVAEFTF